MIELTFFKSPKNPVVFVDIYHHYFASVVLCSKPRITLNTQMGLVLPKQRWNITSSVVHYDVALLQRFHLVGLVHALLYAVYCLSLTSKFTCTAARAHT